MAYLGNEPGVINFVLGLDRFNGTGACTQFTLTRTIDDANALEVLVNSIQQDPISSYSVSGGLVTFTEAPSNGANNIVVIYRSTATINFTNVTTAQIADGAVTSSKLASGSVTTQTIADGSVTGVKLGLTAINANNIVDGAVTGVKLGLTAINANNIVNASITGDKMVANTIGSSNLTTTGVSAGTHGSSSAIPILVIDAQGRVLSASNTSVTSTSVFANSSQLTANSSSGNVLIGLANTAVVASTYGGATNVASIIVDQFGRITSASNVAVSGIDAHPFVFTALGS